MALTLFFPFKSVVGSGQPIMGYAPSVDSLPLAPVGGANVVVMSQDSGSFPAGAYYYNAALRRWYFLLPYRKIMDNLFGIAEAILCLPFQGQTLLPIGSVGAAHVNFYRNGVLQLTGYSFTSQGIVLDNPALGNDYYVVGLISPITATTPAGGGGGVTDVPNDGKVYARSYGQWMETEDMVFNEGTY